MIALSTLDGLAIGFPVAFLIVFLLVWKAP